MPKPSQYDANHFVLTNDSSRREFLNTVRRAGHVDVKPRDVSRQFTDRSHDDEVARDAHQASGSS